MTKIELPNRRECLTFKFVYDNKFSCFGTAGFHPDTGALGEVFLQVGKAGATLEAMSRDAAIAASLALQAGVTLEALREAMTRREANAPTSPLAILLDMIATELKRRDA